MSIYAALGQGIRLVRSNMHIVWSIYFTTLFIALLFVIPFQQTISEEIGNSLEIEHMLDAYRHTVVADFLNAAGNKIVGLVAQLKWLILGYIVISIFFSGSILHSFTQKENSIQSFLKGGILYFGRFFRLTVYIWIIQFILMGLLHFPFISQLLGGLDGIENELSFFRTGIIGLLIHLPLAILVFAISDFAKVDIVVSGERRVWKSLLKTIALFRTFFLKTYSIYVLNGLLIAGIYLIYLLMSNWIEMTTSFAIIMMFIVQQFFSILRVTAKAIKLGSILSMYEHMVSKSPHLSVSIQHK